MDEIGNRSNGPNPPEQTIILVGNPNVGKSVIFNALSGMYATVSNYPGTTVEVSRCRVSINGVDTLMIDSPGINSLVPTSEDERVTRDILLKDKIDSVLQVIDAKNLRRGLLVLIQLLEMGLPVTVALNMFDEAGGRGIQIDVEGLKKRLGIAVVPTIATQRWGMEALKEALITHEPAGFQVKYSALIEQGIKRLIPLMPASKISRRSLALMILAGDKTLNPWLAGLLGESELEKILEIRELVQTRYSEPVGYMINRERLRAADNLLKGTLREEARRSGRVSELIGRWSMHPFWGLLILAGVLYGMYEFVGVFGAGTSVDFLEEHVFGRYVNPWATRVVEYVLPSGFFRDLLVGEFGVITMAFTYAIAIVLPIVSYFFIFFGCLEDSGYLPRLAIMVDRVFRLMSLNGKAVLPMVLGLGCDTMATMTTRILETRKERVIVTLLLALGVPCSAQLGVLLGMLGAVSFKATLVWGSVVVASLILVSFLASKIIAGDTSDFILEIPPIRMPQFSNIAVKTLMRVEWYLKEAVPLFVLGTLVLFALDRTGALAVIERLASPVLSGLLDLPREATGSFLVGFLRRDYGAAGLFALQKQGLLDPVQVVVSLVTITLFVPCVANLIMILKEFGVAVAFWMSLFIFPFAILVGSLLNFTIRFFGVSF